MNLPIKFQRIEGAAIFSAATFMYFDSGLSWIWYVLLLFAFDIFMLGYLINDKLGAYFYNLGHTYLIPSIIVILYLLANNKILLGLACLWFAHIGLDRALGYGLKLTTSFQDTHLGKI